jgi:hypothetical protein
LLPRWKPEFRLHALAIVETTTLKFLRKNFLFLAKETDSEVVGGEGRSYRGSESERAMMRGNKEVKRCLRVTVPKQETLSDFLYT